MEGPNGLGSNTKGHNIFQTPRDTQSNLLAFDGGDAYFMQNIKIIYGRLNALSRLKYSTFCTSPPPHRSWLKRWWMLTWNSWRTILMLNSSKVQCSNDNTLLLSQCGRILLWISVTLLFLIGASLLWFLLVNCKPCDALDAGFSFFIWC